MAFSVSGQPAETIMVRGLSLGSAVRAVTWQEDKEEETGQKDRNVKALI